MFLIGYRGTGKSSVGRIIAELLSLPFVDTDNALESKSKLSIRDFFALRGEEAFRDCESEALREVIAGAPAAGGPVVATGGGIVLRPANVKAMRAAGRVVWLTAPAADIRKRLAADPRSGEARPALAGRSAVDEVEEVLAAREPRYREAAHFQVSTGDRQPLQVAREVVERLRAVEAGGGRR